MNKINLSDMYYKLFGPIFVILNIIFLVVVKIKFNNISTIDKGLAKILDDVFINVFIFVLTSAILIIIYTYVLRKKVIRFSDSICEVVDKVISKHDNMEFDNCEETLLSKSNNKLKQLVEVLSNDRDSATKERDNIRKLIADISHQIKTPIANISMYNQTIIERDLDKENEKKFLKHMQWQVNKLQWLVDGLIKMSRLEGGVITLNCKDEFLSDTIANAVSGVYMKAENKNIDIKINCQEKIMIKHDKKWTVEAIFNILENAVKYNKIGGYIIVNVERMELFTKIDIKDSGIGIAEIELNNIFKRFYRASEVSEVEGVGIGLFLANEIVIKQGGYIKAESNKGEGSIFSVFLPNK